VQKVRLGNVWDEREELFGIGESDEELEEEEGVSRKVGGNDAGSSPPPPKIFVTTA